ncbi:MAG: NosD domain-containing protein, partial [Thermoplasmata archaeon]
ASGENNTVIGLGWMWNQPDGINITNSNNITLYGNNIRCSNNGIYSVSCNNISIQYNAISPCDFGINSRNSNFIRIMNNTIYGRPENEGSTAILIYSSNNTNISGNLFLPDSGTGTSLNGIYAYGISGSCKITNLTIANNSFIKYKSGITVFNITLSNITNNTLNYTNDSGSFGISGGGIDNSSISYNNISYFNSGIRFVRAGEMWSVISNYNIVHNNTIFRSGEGITLDYTENTTLTWNWVENNSYGVILNEKTKKNTVFNNYIIGCSANRFAIDNGTNNQWYVGNSTSPTIIGGPYLGGNYYGNNTNLDYNGDMISEVPYLIAGSANSVDQRPLNYTIPEGEILVLVLVPVFVVAWTLLKKKWYPRILKKKISNQLSFWKGIC